MKPRSMTLMMLLRRGAFACCVPLASSIYLAPPLRRNSRRPQGAAADRSRSTPGYRSGCTISPR